MTDEKLELSRRKILAGLGTVGVASAGAGLGTSAYFSDQETFTNNSLVAGSLDMKVAYSAHYSDWSDDEGEGVDVEMWGGEPGTTGGPDNLAEGRTGLPTNAAWLISVDDPGQFLANTQTAADGDASCPDGTDSDDVEQPIIDLDDVKPGDFGEVTFDFALCDNPGYVWLQGELLSAAENGYTEPEAKDEDESGDADGDGEDDRVELLDVVQAAAWVDNGNNYQDGDEAPFIVGNLREVIGALATDKGFPLEGDIPADDGGGSGGNCFSAGATHSVAFAWWVPVDHGNEIQTDSASFELSFYTEQCRHNMRDTGITIDTETKTSSGFAKVEENFNGDGTISGGARARYGDSGGASTWELAVGDEPGGGDFSQAQYTWSSGTSVDWTLAYDEASDELSFTFDGNTITDTLSMQPDGRIALQGKANEATVDASINSLMIDGTAQTLGSPSSVTATNDGSGREIMYLLLNTSLDGSSSFTLEGTATVTLQGDYPGGDEDVSFDIVLE